MIAGALTTGSLVPQLLRIWKTKSARDISLAFTALFLAGISLWLVYGIVAQLLPVVIWNAVSAALMAAILVFKLIMERRA